MEDEHVTYTPGDTEQVRLGVDFKGNKQWYISTREGWEEIGEKNVLMLNADHFDIGTSIELTNPSKVDNDYYNLGYYQIPNVVQDKIRVIAWKEGDGFVAQCLECDVCVVADNFDEIKHMLDVSFSVELRLGNLDNIEQAPKYFFKLWEMLDEDS